MKSFSLFTPLRNLSMMVLLFFGLILFGAWAALFEIDQSVRAQGQVIAIARTQIIQAVDGGVLSVLSVTEGQPVQAGQLLGVLEKSRAQAGFEESDAKANSLTLALMRAKAETRLGAMSGPGTEAEQFPNFYQAQQSLYRQHRRTLDEDLASLKEALSMAREELRMNNTLFASGDVSQIDLLRSRRQVNEIESRVANVRNKYQQDASAEVTKIEEELASVNARLKERKSILDHTDLIAPVAGIVKLLRVTTIGGVLRPGDELMQIAPDDDALIVEAKVVPIDVGLLSVGLPVSIKIDAFDYSIYGTLSGKLTYISPDTITEQGPNGQSQSYYRVHVRLAPAKSRIGKASHIIIKPGLTASIDIQTGTRTVFTYLAKPVSKAFSGALSER